MKEFLSNNAFSIGAVVFAVFGSYFMLQSHEEQIITLQEKIEELEKNKVSTSEMKLKEQFAAAELQEIRTDIIHIGERLDKKIKIINDIDERLDEVREMNVDQEARIKQNESELDGVWKFINKFLEEL